MNWSTPILFSFPGLSELVVIFIVMLLVFGEKLPSVARKMGRYIGNARRQIDGLRDELLKSPDEELGRTNPPPARPPETMTPLIVERKTIEPTPADNIAATENPASSDEKDISESQNPDKQEP